MKFIYGWILSVAFALKFEKYGMGELFAYTSTTTSSIHSFHKEAVNILYPYVKSSEWNLNEWILSDEFITFDSWAFDLFVKLVECDECRLKSLGCTYICDTETYSLEDVYGFVKQFLRSKLIGDIHKGIQSTTQMLEMMNDLIKTYESLPQLSRKYCREIQLEFSLLYTDYLLQKTCADTVKQIKQIGDNIISNQIPTILAKKQIPMVTIDELKMLLDVSGFHAISKKCETSMLYNKNTHVEEVEIQKREAVDENEKGFDPAPYALISLTDTFQEKFRFVKEEPPIEQTSHLSQLLSLSTNIKGLEKRINLMGIYYEDPVASFCDSTMNNFLSPLINEYTNKTTSIEMTLNEGINTQANKGLWDLVSINQIPILTNQCLNYNLNYMSCSSDTNFDKLYEIVLFPYNSYKRGNEKVKTMKQEFRRSIFNYVHHHLDFLTQFPFCSVIHHTTARAEVSLIESELASMEFMISNGFLGEDDLQSVSSTYANFISSEHNYVNEKLDLFNRKIFNSLNGVADVFMNINFVYFMDFKKFFGLEEIHIGTESEIEDTIKIQIMEIMHNPNLSINSDDNFDSISNFHVKTRNVLIQTYFIGFQTHIEKYSLRFLSDIVEKYVSFLKDKIQLFLHILNQQKKALPNYLDECDILSQKSISIFSKFSSCLGNLKVQFNYNCMFDQLEPIRDLMVDMMRIEQKIGGLIGMLIPFRCEYFNQQKLIKNSDFCNSLNDLSVNSDYKNLDHLIHIKPDEVKLIDISSFKDKQ